MESSSVYDLINKLCERFSQEPRKVKNLRSKCYELLLGKRISSEKKKFRDLSIDDPVCNLLAWQYILLHQYRLTETSNQLIAYHEFIEESFSREGKIDTYHTILKFLLSLRDIPKVKDDKMDLSLLPHFDDAVDFNKLFRLPASLSLGHLDDSFHLKQKPRVSEIKSSCSYPNFSQKFSRNSLKLEADFKQSSSQQSDERNIWEIAASEPYNKRRTWESYGYPEPDKEPLFLSELGDLSSLWVDNLYSIHFSKLICQGVPLQRSIISRKNFIRDLKYLLVGMASESFTYNDYGELVLIPDSTLDAITEETLQLYCQDFTLSGTCYKALNKISIPDPYTNKYKCSGYIFAELCQSLYTYLQFYRTAVMSISNSIGVLDFRETTSQLRKQIATVASICKIGPYKRSEEMPQGVALLNYLYQKISEVTDKKIILVLYSILYPCCQIYFGRFILQWMLDGSINDPYDEFFIKTNNKYISTRGRTYWTRSFIIRQDIIPDFFIGLEDSILLCGKMMNLLKLCYPSSGLCNYLMGKKPQIVSCCITRDQLIVLEQCAQTYFLEVSEECQTNFSLSLMLQKEKELNENLLDHIAKKRAATLKRIEVERQKKAQEEYERKFEERSMLKEQYDIALQQKQFYILQDIERDIRMIESNIQIEKKRERLIQEEAKDLIEYYEQLYKISDAKRMRIEKHLETFKKSQLDPTQKSHLKPNDSGETMSEEKSEPLTDVDKEITPSETNINASENGEYQEMHSSRSLDELNANLNESESGEKEEDTGNNNVESSEIVENDNYRQALENFEAAKRNKLKVMNVEFENLTGNEPFRATLDTSFLTEAQRNKLKVMSTEFGMEFKPRQRVDKELTLSDINKFKMMSSSVFHGENYKEKNETENLVIKEMDTKHVDMKRDEVTIIPEIKTENKIGTKNNPILSLDLYARKDFKSGSDNEKYLPMSVDSTPLSEAVSISTTSASRIYFGEDKKNFSSFPTTAGTEMTDDGGFRFNENLKTPEISNFQMQMPVFSKTFSSKDVKNIEPMSLRMFLRESLSYSLSVQLKLVSSELMRYFITELKYFDHLENLRRYFFLQDGEYGEALTEFLYHKLYNVKFPVELINFSVLSYIIQGALEDSNRSDGCDNLSFKINDLPDSFHLGDVDVLSCISLTYKVEWPLNILLPCDAIAKYNDIFKFMLKIKRMNWVLKTMYLNLRMLGKEAGIKQQYLMMSVHFRKIQQYRYVMLHFVQTLQNYVAAEIFQTQWILFENSLENVTNIDELYDAHTQYVKNILFLCLLNQKSAPLKKVFDKIFAVILKFYDHLRTKQWECKDGTFIHSSFTKLESIFHNFIDLVLYLFKVGKRVVKNGYQPNFKHFLDALDSNYYYSNLSN